jgi:Mn-dependent DtxR family transcriptional regulator
MRTIERTMNLLEEQDRPMTAKEISETLDVSYRNALQALNSLRRWKLVMAEKSGKNAVWRKV